MSVADQAVSSSSNLLVLLLGARYLSPEDFGTLSLIMATVSLFVLVSRSSLGTMIGHAAELGEPAVLGITRTAAGVAILWTPVFWAGSTAALLVSRAEISWEATVVLAVAIPTVVQQDLRRFSASACSRPQRALLGDLTWLLVFIGGVGLHQVTLGEPSLAGILALWLTGAITALVVMVKPRGFHVELCDAWKWFRAHSRYLVHASLSPVASSGAGWVRYTSIAAVAGSAAVGAQAAVSLLFSPVSLLVALFLFSVLPGVVRNGSGKPLSMVRSYLLWGLAFSVLNLLWAVVLSHLPPSLGRHLLGESWTEAAGLIWQMAALSFSIVVFSASGAALLTMRLTTALLLVSVATGLVNVASAWGALSRGWSIGPLIVLEGSVFLVGAAVSWLVVLLRGASAAHLGLQGTRLGGEAGHESD